MGYKTQAFLLDAINADFKLETIELDDPLDDEVLIEVSACSLCHTDLLIQNGAFPSAFPNTTGELYPGWGPRSFVFLFFFLPKRGRAKESGDNLKLQCTEI